MKGKSTNVADAIFALSHLRERYTEGQYNLYGVLIDLEKHIRHSESGGKNSVLEHEKQRGATEVHQTVEGHVSPMHNCSEVRFRNKRKLAYVIDPLSAPFAVCYQNNYRFTDVKQMIFADVLKSSFTVIPCDVFTKS